MDIVFSNLRFPSRAPTGVPISDPFAEVQLLKTWARLCVYSTILAFSPVDIYLAGMSFGQTLFIQIASVSVATAAIEGIFRQSLRLRKRSAYPALLLVEAGSRPSLAEAEAACLSVLHRLLGIPAGLLFTGTSIGELRIVSCLGWSADVAEPIVSHLTDELDACLRSHVPAVILPPPDLPAAIGSSLHERLAIVPVLAFSELVGVAVVAASWRNADIRDTELLRGIGHAIGLSLENLRQKEEIQAKEERLRAVITGAPVVLLNIDAHGIFTLLEGKGLERLNIQANDVVGRSVFDVFANLPDVVREFNRALGGEVVTATAQIADTIFEAQLCPVRDPVGQVLSVIGVATDVTERKQAEETIRHMAYHDSLTGLPNREYFERSLTENLARARRDGRQLAVLFLDLDGFKKVNDSVGHVEGDRVLNEVACRLKEVVREGDVVARIGGDEFLCLLPEINGKDEAAAIAERILEAFRRDWVAGGLRFRMSASIGIAVHPADGRDADALLRKADRAMYEAKNLGRGCYALVHAGVLQAD